ncbi:MAG: FHA domain-containing protein [Bacteroidaceae bacterium]|nr:FHA domain-containing protein [Bacteroidaceae bacterium]
MKRVRCPKCDGYIQFDETKYTVGQSLMFECPNCKKKFSIRMGATALSSTIRDSRKNSSNPDNGYGYITVIENVFAYKQQFALQYGDNVIGRYNKGDVIDIAIDTTDRSMDRRHCVITVSGEPGHLEYHLRDFPSLTGTFLFNTILGDKERALIEDGAIITLGATTIIFSEPENR